MDEKLSGLGPIATDTDTAKEQIEDLKALKKEVDLHHVDIEFLNQQAAYLMKDCAPEQASSIKEPMADVAKRWDNLIHRLGDRNVCLMYISQIFDKTLGLIMLL